MHITTTTHEFFKLAQIEKPGALTVSLLLTADCFVEQSPKTAVMPYLYADLLLSGAGDYSRSDFLHALNSIGATITVTTQNGRITIEVAALKAKLTQTLQLLMLTLTKPSFKSTEVKRAISTLSNTIELAKEDARTIAQAHLKNSFYKKTDRQYSFNPETLSTALTGISQQDIKKLHQTFMDSYWFVSIGGSKESIQTTLKTITAIKQSALIRPEIEGSSISVKKSAVLMHEVKSKQNIEISIGNAVPLTLSDEDAPAFLFGLAVLGKWGGFAGRLMSTVREKEGLTYGIYARTESMGLTNPGYWRIMSFFAPKDVVKGITSTKREIKLIAEKGITQSEFERFKTIIKTGEELKFDSLGGTTSLVHGNLVSGLLWSDYLDFRTKFQACTKAQINTALKKYLHPDSLIISTAGPVASVKRELLSLAK